MTTPESTAPHHLQTANIFVRFVAFLIDIILLLALACAFMWVAMGPIPKEMRTSQEGQTSAADKSEFLSYADSMRDPTLWHTTVPSMVKRFPGILACAFLLFPFLYYAGFDWLFGGTFGKLFTNMRVRRKDGGKISLGTACIRAIAKEIFIGLFMLGLIYALFDKKKQALHDKVANTLVLKRRKKLAGATV